MCPASRKTILADHQIDDVPAPHQLEQVVVDRLGAGGVVSTDTAAMGRATFMMTRATAKENGG